MTPGETALTLLGLGNGDLATARRNSGARSLSGARDAPGGEGNSRDLFLSVFGLLHNQNLRMQPLLRVEKRETLTGATFNPLWEGGNSRELSRFFS